MTKPVQTSIRDLEIRNCQPEDHSDVIEVLKDWWHGRDLTHMLPKLFFIHFNNSSYVAYHEDRLTAFLIGFLSQSIEDEAYIHFAGVHPDYRGIGLGTLMYHKFFDYCRLKKRKVVRSNTSPVNIGSIQFHTKLGFEILPGDAVVDGVQAKLDYNRPGDPKVRFSIHI